MVSLRRVRRMPPAPRARYTVTMAVALLVGAFLWLVDVPSSVLTTVPSVLLPTLELQRELLERSISDRTLLDSCQAGNATERLPELVSQRVLRSMHPRSPRSIALVTQLSLNRLGMLENQCIAYRDSIAAVVYIAITQQAGTIVCPEAPELHGRLLSAGLAAVGKFHRRMERTTGACALDIQVVTEAFPEGDEEDQAAGLYPFNAVRNRALMLAQTEAILILDVDFVPSSVFSEEMTTNPQAYHGLMTNLRSGHLLVIPAFETTETDPKRGRELVMSLALGGKGKAVEAFKEGQLAGFQVSGFGHGHNSTNYPKWMDPATLQPYPIQYVKGYEPYLVALRQNIPWYDERFRGYGRDKITHLLHVSTLPLEFQVHPSAYVIHVPHKKAATYKITKRGPQWDYLYNLFQESQIKILEKRWTPTTAFAEACHMMRQPGNLTAILAPLVQ